jgi:DTW domain-containing protein YfiP
VGLFSVYNGSATRRLIVEEMKRTEALIKEEAKRSQELLEKLSEQHATMINIFKSSQVK